jgi:RNA polymerase sigma factor (sigma-70 family)
VVDWPQIDRSDDEHMANALRGGEADAFPELYRAYSGRLFDYCHQLLHDDLDAARALHDTFVVALERLHRLGTPGQLRPWLYLIARNECMRLREAVGDRQTPREAPRRGDDLASLSPTARRNREETQNLVRSSQAGLDGMQLELLDLSIRHEIGSEDLAAILRVPVPHAVSRVAHAREDFDRAYNAALIAFAGREVCAEMAALVDGWPLSATASLRLLRHMDDCAACDQWPRQEAALPELLSIMPETVLPEQLYSMIMSTFNGPVAERRTLARRAGPWDESGRPVPLGDAEDDKRRRPSLMLVARVAAALVLVAGIGGVILAVSSGAPGAGAASRPPTLRASIGPGDPTTLPAGPTTSPTSATPRPSTSPTVKKTTGRVVSTTRSTTGAPTVATPPSTRRTKNSPDPGTLRVSGCTMPNYATMSCGMTITAVGGPVSWRVTGVPSGFTASGSGHLAAGRSTTVTVRIANNVWCVGEIGGSVTFSPNGSGTVTWLC